MYLSWGVVDTAAELCQKGDLFQKGMKGIFCLCSGIFAYFR